MNGLHLIGDLTGCRCDPQWLTDAKRFEEKCVALVNASGLTVMDARFLQFDGAGYTGTIVLAESHLACIRGPSATA
jgi:spermidine synthase